MAALSGGRSMLRPPGRLPKKYAPGVMGACRALNLALEMSRTPLHLTASCLVPLGLMWLYVTPLTLFARKEAGGIVRWRLTCGTTGVCLAVVFVPKVVLGRLFR